MTLTIQHTGNHMEPAVTAAPGVLANLPASILYQLADLAGRREQTGSWQQLPADSLDQAVAMLADGQRPALGWWRTHLPQTDAAGWPTPIPSNTRRPWQPWELTAAAIALAEDHTDNDTARDVLAQLAVDHHLDTDIAALADAYRALADR